MKQAFHATALILATMFAFQLSYSGGDGKYDWPFPKSLAKHGKPHWSEFEEYSWLERYKGPDFEKCRERLPREAGSSQEFANNICDNWMEQIVSNRHWMNNDGFAAQAYKGTLKLDDLVEKTKKQSCTSRVLALRGYNSYWLTEEKILGIGPEATED